MYLLPTHTHTHLPPPTHTHTHTHTHTSPTHNHYHRLIWSFFLLFTFFHLFANHRAVSVVKMETFNQNRLHIIMDDYLSSGKVPSPASANAREPILGSK